MTMQEHYIDTDKALQTFCEDIKDAEWLAIDTEFIREKTYYAKLCLIQIGTESSLAAIDPLKIEDLSPLYAILQNDNITKVFHAAGQDLEIFYQLSGSLPQAIFDTQLAAALLGYGEQIGYAALVKSILNITLEKAHSRTDWSQRPLDTQQIEYAMDDVRYLSAIYPILKSELIKSQRLDWLTTDISALVNTTHYQIDLDTLWQRTKNHGKLRGAQLNVLKHLAIWRENRAIEIDKPRRWVLTDDVLINISIQLPKTLDKLKKIRGLDTNLAAKISQQVLPIIEKALQEPKTLWPTTKHYRKNTLAQDALGDIVAAIIKLKAEEEKISPTLLTTRDDINRLVQGDKNIPLLEGWRYKIAGESILEFLQGNGSLHYQNGKLSYKEEA